MSSFFSAMMDESNDKTEVLYHPCSSHGLGDIRTRFLDMPTVNVGTARNLFDTLKQSLSNNGLGTQQHRRSC